MSAAAPQFETVVGLVPRARLGDLLSVIHGAGLGRQVSVIDPARGDAAGRLRRLGIDSDALQPRADEDAVLVVVPAPGRLVKAEAMLADHGATVIERHRRIPTREHAWFNSLFGGPDPANPAAG